MAVKRQKSAQELADNWAAGYASATSQKKYKDGINAFTGNPMQIAASDKAMQKYQDKVLESVTSGYRKRRLEASDPMLWKTNAITTGAASMSAGATKGKPKFKKQMDTYAAVQHEASVNADAATGVAAKVLAAVNTFRRAAGKPDLS